MFQEAKQFYREYDPGTSYVYGRLGSPSGHPVSGRNFISNPGQSNVWTAVDGTPFDPVNVGDQLVVFSPRPDGRFDAADVTVKTDGTIINTRLAAPSVFESPSAFMFWPFKVGTTDADGWHHVEAWSAITVYVDVRVLAATSIEIQVQGTGGNWSQPVDLEAEQSLSAVGTLALNIDKVTPYMRVGIKATGAGTDRVTVWAVGEMLQAK